MVKEIYADLSAKNNLEWMQYIERKRQHQAREDRRSDIVRMLLETNKGAAGMFIREQDAAGMFAAAPRRPIFPFESLTEQFLAPWLRRAEHLHVAPRPCSPRLVGTSHRTVQTAPFLSSLFCRGTLATQNWDACDAELGRLRRRTRGSTGLSVARGPARRSRSGWPRRTLKTRTRAPQSPRGRWRPCTPRSTTWALACPRRRSPPRPPPSRQHAPPTAAPPERDLAAQVRDRVESGARLTPRAPRAPAPGKARKKGAADPDKRDAK